VEDFVEEERICLLLTGAREPRHWGENSQPLSIFDLKGDVTDLLHKFVLDKSRFISYSTSNRLADDVVAIEINGSYAGYFGKVKEDVLDRFGIKQDVFMAEIQLGALQSVKRSGQYVSLPKFPKVRRDVAFVVKDAAQANVVEGIIRKASSPLLQSVELFDVYRGENIPAGKKSLAYTLELMSRERTLTDPEIDAEIERIVAAVVAQTGGVLRAL
jgi:phenylalanyl-tRNA synthetase beta chain